MKKIMIMVPVVLFILFTSISYTKSPDKTHEFRTEAIKLNTKSEYKEVAEMFLKAVNEENKNCKPGPVFLHHSYREGGYNFYLIRNLAKSVEFFEEALLISKKIEKKELIAEDYYDTGLAYQAWKKYSKSIFNESLLIYRRLDNKYQIARNLNSMADVYRLGKNYNKSIESHNEALEIYKKLSERDNIDAQFGNIGSVYLSWGKYNEALKNFLNTFLIYKEEGSKYNVVVQHSNLGITYTLMGIYDKAPENLYKSMAIGKEFKNIKIETDAHHKYREHSSCQMRTGYSPGIFL